MNRLAGDIVLLPAFELMEGAVRLNRELLKSSKDKIVLNTIDCLPHLSLAMGCVKEEEIPALANLLEEITRRFPPIRLEITGIRVGAIATGESVSSLTVERTPELQSLHERIMNRIAPYVTEDAAPEMFIDFPKVDPASVEWVNRYRDAAGFGRFSPHITLGVGALETAIPFPLGGTASRLALCHLGNYCACRRILFETALRG
ncbi:MAG TPA: 2'-5' RNA ligase family protein [Candidatus Manganitrophaceae bacterium]|nr:2'-5' RNA ligase family protein [Candidatus Manganitrophaceae bacterium]